MPASAMRKQVNSSISCDIWSI